MSISFFLSALVTGLILVSGATTASAIGGGLITYALCKLLKTALEAIS